MGAHNELSAMARWDRHEPLANATTSASSATTRPSGPNPPVVDQHVNALVLGYTFDTRPLSGAGQPATYAAAPQGQPVRSWPAAAPGLPAGLDVGDRRTRAEGRRRLRSPHPQRARLPPDAARTLLSLRGLFGFSNGTLPIERLFAIGGIGSVHGYSFKEASGTGMTLLNAEYRVNLWSAAAIATRQRVRASTTRDG